MEDRQTKETNTNKGVENEEMAQEQGTIPAQQEPRTCPKTQRKEEKKKNSLRGEEIGLIIYTQNSEG